MPLYRCSRFITCCLLLLFGHIVPLAQDYHLTRHFTVEDGLPGIITKNGFMDSKGYLWVATENGLSRYDGVAFKNFYHNPDDPSSLCWNIVNDFFEDGEGYLWIGTGKGLARFDYLTETFTCFMNDPGDPASISGDWVNSFFQDSDKNIWVSTHRAGFNLFHKKEGTFTSFPIKEGMETHHQRWEYNTVNDMVEDGGDPNILWLACHRNGIRKFDKSNQQVNPVDIGFYAEHNALFSDRPGELWVGTRGSGLVMVNTLTGEGEEVKNSISNLGAVVSNQLIINDIEPIDCKKLMLATEDYGVFVFDRNRRAYRPLIPDLEETLTKDMRAVEKLLFDKQQRLWAFTRGGVLLFDPNASFVERQQLPLTGMERHHDGNKVTALDIDSKGTIWVSSYYGYGVHRKRKGQRQFEPVDLSLGYEPRDGRYFVQKLMVDSRDDVWITSSGVLAKYNPIMDRFEPFQPEKLKRLLKKNASPNILKEDSEGNIWIGTPFGGLIKYEVENDTFKHFVSWEENDTILDANKNVSGYTFDSNGNVWVATDIGGVYVFDAKKEQYTRRFLFGNNGGAEKELLGVAETPNGNIWVSKKYIGIRTIDPTQPDNQEGGLITRKDGLPNANIFKMGNDQDGHLWMATFQGLIRYDYEKKEYRVFGKREGISDLFDWDIPFEITRNGQLFLGNQDGTFYLFHPDSLPVNNVPPPLVFTKLEVLGKEKPLEKSLNYIDELVLPYAENFFAISFAALNFTNPEDNQYRYILEGYDNGWTDSGNRSFASYTNVREGTYTFRVKASNNDGVWNEEGISLKIKVLPPWYRSWWAFLCYALLAAGGVYAAYRFQRHRWQLQSKLHIEQAEAARLKEMDETKSRLYANITHEFRTPLTVILGMAEQLQLNPKIDWQGRLQAIEKNGGQLLDLVNQMLDLSKLQSGNMQADYIQGDIVAYLGYLVQSYQSFAESQGKTLVFQSETDSFTMDYDPEKIKRVLDNLLSNAIKFTNENGVVKVGASPQPKEGAGEGLVIKVSDNGRGILPADLPYIFDRFYQADSSSTRQGEGTGIGLAMAKEMVGLMKGEIRVESEQGKGTVFEIRLPVSRTAIAPPSPLQKPPPSPLQRRGSMPCSPLLWRGSGGGHFSSSSRTTPT